MIPIATLIAALTVTIAQDDGSFSESSIAPSAVPEVRIAAVEAEMRVEGALSTIRQTIHLVNPANRAGEWQLTLPMGPAGELSGIALQRDGQTVDGLVLDADEARAAFRERVGQGGGAALLEPTLLENWGQASYRAAVSVEANSESTVTLTYQRLLQRDGDLHRAQLPLSFLGAVDVPLTVTAELSGSAPYRTLYSPSHDVQVEDEWVSWSAEGEPTHHARIRHETTSGAAQRDLLLYHRAVESADLLDVAVIAEPDGTGGGHFVAVVSGSIDEEAVPEPRNVIFVLDRSGSMKEGKLDQARVALEEMLDRLRPEDRFDVVSYAEDVTAFAGLLQGTTPDSVARAKEHLAALVAEGGTNIEEGLVTALDELVQDGAVNQIVFLTDGLPSHGATDTATLCAAVAKANVKDARIVALGVGFDVNSMLLDRLARENHGLSEFVLPGEDVAARVAAFCATMESPLVLDATLTAEGVELVDVLPAALGDLYGGQQAVLSGRYRSAGTGTLVLSGTHDGKPVRHEFPVAFESAATDGGEEFAARLWAGRRIGTLVDELRLFDPLSMTEGEAEAWRVERSEEIVRLGTRYGILTEYTAFLASDETDLYGFADNVAACTSNFANWGSIASGAHGVAQACNSKDLQRAGGVGAFNNWIGASGEAVSIEAVRCTAGRAFFKRGERWLDSNLVVAETSEVDARKVSLYSDEFFTLLDAHPWLGRCVAHTGELVVEVAGEAIHIAGA